MRKLVAMGASVAALGAAVATTGTASAAEIEVKMLNKGAAGMMVFEPAFVKAEPGDTVRFVAVDKGHNAESIAGMLPEGAEPFAGKFNQEITRSEEHTSELQSLMRISYAVFCLNKKKQKHKNAKKIQNTIRKCLALI